jgi:hypothetical protein
MKTLVLVFIWMTSELLAESCQGDRSQGQQSVLKIANSPVEVHSVWHDTYIATETEMVHLYIFFTCVNRVRNCCVLLRVVNDEIRNTVRYTDRNFIDNWYGPERGMY